MDILFSKVLKKEGMQHINLQNCVLFKPYEINNRIVVVTNSMTGDESNEIIASA